MSCFEKWLTAEIRSVYFSETQRGATPRARNRARMLAERENQRERQLRNQVYQKHGVNPEELLRRKMAK
jgi:hypothetical protein